jgi:hypothetical protein
MLTKALLRMVVFSLFLGIARADGSYGNQKTLYRNLRQEAIVGVIPLIEELLRLRADINSQAMHGETALESIWHRYHIEPKPYHD